MNWLIRIFEATRFYRTCLFVTLLILAGVQLADKHWLMVAVDAGLAFLSYPEILSDGR